MMLSSYSKLKEAVEWRLAQDQLRLLNISIARMNKGTRELKWIRLDLGDDADVVFIPDNENLYCAVQPSS